MADDYYTLEDREGNQAIDENLKLSTPRGFAVKTGCEVVIDEGTLTTDRNQPADTLTVREGAVLVDATHHHVDGPVPVSLPAPTNHPRWDVVHVDDNGDVVVEQGTEEPRDPPDVDRMAVKRPAPPDMSRTTGTVLAMVWVPAGVEFIGDADIVSRRTEGGHALHRVQATGVFQETHVREGDHLIVPDEHVLNTVGPYTIDGRLTINGRLHL